MTDKAQLGPGDVLGQLLDELNDPAYSFTLRLARKQLKKERDRFREMREDLYLSYFGACFDDAAHRTRNMPDYIAIEEE